MKNTLLLTLIAAAFAGCSHHPIPTLAHGEPPESRQPNQIVGENIQVMGRVGLSVNKTEAGFDGDAFYFVQVDCNRDRKLSREEQGIIVKINSKTVSEKQRREFASYKKRSARQNKDANAAPYLMVDYNGDGSGYPCNGSGIGKMYSGSDAIFSRPKR